MSSLTPDSSDRTNQLLLLLIMGANNSTLTPADINPSFTPAAGVVRQNCFFFASLFASLLAAAGAVLAKQWLANYERTGQTGTLEEQGLRRTIKFRGAEKWYLQQVVEVLPTLVLLSLGLFFVAITDFLCSVNIEVAAIAWTLSIFGTLCYAVMLIVAAVYPDCPYQTAPSMALLYAWHSIRSQLSNTLITFPKCLSFIPTTKAVNFISPSLGEGSMSDMKVEVEAVETVKILIAGGGRSCTGAAIQNPTARSGDSLPQTPVDWQGPSTWLGHPLRRHQIAPGLDRREMILVEAAVSMLKITPRDDVFLAVAWSIPTVKNVENIQRLVRWIPVTHMVSSLLFALASSHSGREDFALTWARAIAYILVAWPSTPIPMTEEQVTFFDQIVGDLKSADLRILFISLLRCASAGDTTWTVSDDFMGQLSGKLTISSWTIIFYLRLTYSSQLTRRRCIDCLAALLALLSTPNTSFGVHGHSLILAILERVLDGAWSTEPRCLDVYHEPLEEATGGFVPSDSTLTIEIVKRVLMRSERLMRADFSGEDGGVLTTLTLVVAKWCCRLKELEGFELSPHQSAAVYWACAQMSETRTYALRCLAEPTCLGNLAHLPRWRQEVDWTLLSPFYPTIGRFGTHTHFFKLHHPSMAIFKAAAGTTTELGIGRFIHHLTLGTNELKHPSPNTIWKIATVAMIIWETGVGGGSGLLDRLHAHERKTSSSTTENEELRTKLNAVYGELYLAAWSSFISQSEPLRPMVTKSSIQIIHRYMRALCDREVVNVDYSITIPVTSNPYWSARRDSKDVVKTSLSPRWALRFASVACMSDHRIFAKQIGLHHACEEMVQRFPDLDAKWIEDARESYRTMDREPVPAAHEADFDRLIVEQDGSALLRPAMTVRSEELVTTGVDNRSTLESPNALRISLAKAQPRSKAVGTDSAESEQNGHNSGSLLLDEREARQQVPREVSAIDCFLKEINK